uniref:DUF4116 domain-containing protein n=1 Tax=viral metagenome TaxID=1070528 RepID=A0A6C0BTZ5_9ZZZZ
MAEEYDGSQLEFESGELRDDDEFVKKAVEQNGLALKFASKRLQDDSDIVQTAVEENGLSLRFASGNIKENDFTIVLTAVLQNGLSLQFASEEFRDETDIVQSAVEENGLALEFASDRLRDETDIVQSAVEENGLALEFASDRLRDNFEIVLYALERNELALEFASRRLQSDVDKIAMGNAIRNDWSQLKFAPPHLKDDNDIVWYAVKQNVSALQFASPRLKNDDALVLYAVKQNGLALEFASPRLKDDIHIVSTAVKQNGLAIYFAWEGGDGGGLQNDEHIISIALAQNPDVFNQHPKDLPVGHSSEVPQQLFKKSSDTPTLFITTHGEISGDIFDVPLSIEKLNAVGFGVCNFVSETFLKDALIEVTNHPRFGLYRHSESFKLIDRSKREKFSGPYVSSMKDKRYRDDMDGYRIGSIKKGQQMYDNKYSIPPGEYEPYDGLQTIGKNVVSDRILLIENVKTKKTKEEYKITDIGKLYLDRKRVNLSTILSDLALKKYSDIKIIDFSCKILLTPVGSYDFIRDTGLAYGNEIKQIKKSKKSKKGKKGKKGKKSKRRKSTKKRKTRKKD